MQIKAFQKRSEWHIPPFGTLLIPYSEGEKKQKQNPNNLYGGKIRGVEEEQNKRWRLTTANTPVIDFACEIKAHLIVDVLCNV